MTSYDYSSRSLCSYELVLSQDLAKRWYFERPEPPGGMICGTIFTVLENKSKILMYIKEKKKAVDIRYNRLRWLVLTISCYLLVFYRSKPLNNSVKLLESYL